MNCHLHRGSLVIGKERAFVVVRSRADGDQTGIHAIPAIQSAASMTAVLSSYFSDRPAAKSGVLQRATYAMALTCGGDRRYLFVGCITVAACSARWHVGAIGLLEHANRSRASTSQAVCTFRPIGNVAEEGMISFGRFEEAKTQ